MGETLWGRHTLVTVPHITSQSGPRDRVVEHGMCVLHPNELEIVRGWLPV